MPKFKSHRQTQQNKTSSRQLQLENDNLKQQLENLKRQIQETNDARQKERLQLDESELDKQINRNLYQQSVRASDLIKSTSDLDNFSDDEGDKEIIVGRPNLTKLQNIPTYKRRDNIEALQKQKQVLEDQKKPLLTQMQTLESEIKNAQAKRQTLIQSSLQSSLNELKQAISAIDEKIAPIDKELELATQVYDKFLIDPKELDKLKQQRQKYDQNLQFLNQIPQYWGGINRDELYKSQSQYNPSFAIKNYSDFKKDYINYIKNNPNLPIIFTDNDLGEQHSIENFINHAKELEKLGINSLPELDEKIKLYENLSKNPYSTIETERVNDYLDRVEKTLGNTKDYYAWLKMTKEKYPELTKDNPKFNEALNDQIIKIEKSLDAYDMNDYRMYAEQASKKPISERPPVTIQDIPIKGANPPTIDHILRYNLFNQLLSEVPNVLHVDPLVIAKDDPKLAQKKNKLLNKIYDKYDQEHNFEIDPSYKDIAKNAYENYQKFPEYKDFLDSPEREAIFNNAIEKLTNKLNAKANIIPAELGRRGVGQGGVRNKILTDVSDELKRKTMRDYLNDSEKSWLFHKNEKARDFDVAQKQADFLNKGQKSDYEFKRDSNRYNLADQVIGLNNINKLIQEGTDKKQKQLDAEAAYKNLARHKPFNVYSTLASNLSGNPYNPETFIKPIRVEKPDPATLMATGLETFNKLYNQPQTQKKAEGGIIEPQTSEPVGANNNDFSATLENILQQQLLNSSQAPQVNLEDAQRDARLQSYFTGLANNERFIDTFPKAMKGADTVKNEYIKNMQQQLKDSIASSMTHVASKHSMKSDDFKNELKNKEFNAELQKLPFQIDLIKAQAEHQRNANQPKPISDFKKVELYERLTAKRQERLNQLLATKNAIDLKVNSIKNALDTLKKYGEDGLSNLSTTVASALSKDDPNQTALPRKVFEALSFGASMIFRGAKKTKITNDKSQAYLSLLKDLNDVAILQQQASGGRTTAAGIMAFKSGKPGGGAGSAVIMKYLHNLQEKINSDIKNTLDSINAVKQNITQGNISESDYLDTVENKMSSEQSLLPDQSLLDQANSKEKIKNDFLNSNFQG